MRDPLLKQRVKAFYDEYHQGRLRTPDPRVTDRIWSCFSGRVLEVGVGRLPWEGAKTPDSYLAADISVEAIRRIDRRLARGVQCDGENLPFADQAFDVVACHDVLEHVVDPVTFLSELCRVSTYRVIVAGPNYVGKLSGGFDRFLPRRLAMFLLDPGSKCEPLRDPHLVFYEEWQPDKDAVTAANSSWVVQTMHKNGFQVVVLSTWWPNSGLLLFDRLPVLRHFGPFMIVVGEREVRE